jgi:hypothetical protein
MVLRTDGFGSETSYSLTATDGSSIWSASSLENNREYTESVCVDPSGCYQFTIGDTYGDGITGDGLTLTYGGEIDYQGGNFGPGGYRDLGDGCD